MYWFKKRKKKKHQLEKISKKKREIRKDKKEYNKAKKYSVRIEKNI